MFAVVKSQNLVHPLHMVKDLKKEENNYNFRISRDFVISYLKTAFFDFGELSDV